MYMYMQITSAPSSSGSQTTVTRIAPVHSGATTSATAIIVTDSDLEGNATAHTCTCILCV